jgi:hypothetical protein
MGSWSVYCGISQIAITSGQECVLLPLKKDRLNGSYLPYLPATLPIFGKYDDYGGIEDIEKNANTEKIEEYFHCTIEEFCTFFTRGLIRDDEDDFPMHLKTITEFEKWKFMFIDRKVYDFMSTNVHKGYGGAGSLNFGNKQILELLGFTYVGESQESDFANESDAAAKYLASQIKRYKYTWELNGEKFYSDGTWLHHKTGSIHNLTGNQYANLTDIVKVAEDKLWLNDKAMWQLWEHLEEKKQAEELFWIIGIDYSNWTYQRMAKQFNFKNEPKKSTTIADQYVEDVKTFGGWMCELRTIRHNLHCMSGYFVPYELYLTPQCGEYNQHQVLLEKFAEINKTYLRDEEL